ncbi:MAG: nicotinamide riboside transporter PnuC [Sphingobacteriales bacterium]|nr:MAG: nicotinamide riboside transporter PnuC [Sphingobacteriales bacterium]
MVPAQQLYQLFIDNIQQTRWQEWVSTIAQVASVWYAKKNNVLVYPTGIVGVLLAFWVYFFMASPPLYADGILNIYYFLMSVYGWYNWAQKKGDEQYNYPISWCSPKELQIGMALFIGFWIGIYILLISITDSNTPLLDSLVSATAVTAMWWMAKRKIENWLAWIVSNIIAIPLNFYKGFMLFVVMYVLFLVLATMGFAAWKKKIKTTKA